MIELTENNINKAIVNKGLDIVNKSRKGFILTNETICTYNSLIIFKELFKNRCKMLDNALENLYYIVDRLIPCQDDGGDDSDDTYYNVTVNTTPENAVVTINGNETKFISVLKGSTVNIVAKLSGYYDKTKTITNIQQDEVVNIAFTEEDKIPTPRYYDITVNTIPSNAIVKINNIIRNTASLAENTTCNIVVSADGYETHTESFVITENKILNITLTPVQSNDIMITVNCTPADAQVLINGIERKVITVQKDSVVTIKALKEGYQTFNLTKTYSKSTTVNISLVEIPVEENITITVNPNPVAADVYIDGILGAVQEVKKGTHTILVTRNGFNDWRLTDNFTADRTIDVRLTVQLTVNVTPSDAIVTIDGNTSKSMAVYPGRHYIVASKQGYITETRTVDCPTHITVNIDLEEESVIETATVKVVTTQNFANVLINGELLKEKTLPIGTQVSIRVYADGYIPWVKTFTLTSDVTEYVTLKNTQTVHWNIYKQDVTDSTIRQGITAYYIYDDDINQIHHGITNDADMEMDINRAFTVYANASGYTPLVNNRPAFEGSYTKVYINLPLIPEEVVNTCTLTINAIPQDAVVTLNNVVQNSITVTEGETVHIQVSKTGYIPYDEYYRVLSDETKTIELQEEIVNHRIIVQPTPSDANVTINNVSTREGNYPNGTELTIVVAKEGYTTKTVTHTVTADATIPVVLDEIVIPTYTLTINTSPSDATVLINGVQRRSIELHPGDSVTVETSKQYYNTDSRTIVMGNSDKTETIVLNRKKVNVSVNVTPASVTPTIKINNVETSSLDVDAGSTVTIVVTAPYYESYSETINVEETNIVRNIQLVKKKVTLTVIVSDDDGFYDYDYTEQVLIGNTRVPDVEGKHSLLVEAGSQYLVTITRPYYQMLSEFVEVGDEDKTIYRDLTRQQYLLTINTIPENASVVITDEKLNSETTKSRYIYAGTRATVEVSAEGYVSKQTWFLIDNRDRTETIELEKNPVQLVINSITDDYFGNSIENYTLYLNNIDKTNDKNISVPKDSTVQIRCVSENYETYEDTITMDDNKSINIVMVSIKKRITIVDVYAENVTNKQIDGDDTIAVTSGSVKIYNANRSLSKTMDYVDRSSTRLFQYLDLPVNSQLEIEAYTNASFGTPSYIYKTELVKHTVSDNYTLEVEFYQMREIHFVYNGTTKVILVDSVLENDYFSKQINRTYSPVLPGNKQYTFVLLNENDMNYYEYSVYVENGSRDIKFINVDFTNLTPYTYD